MNKDKIRKLKEILEKADSSNPEAIKKEASEFLKTIDANELIAAEQALVDEGLLPETLRHLCPAHMDLLREQLGDLKSTLEASHPIHILMSEHEEIMKFLVKLEKLNRKIQKIETMEKLSPMTITALKKIANDLLSAEKHHKREEDSLFPAIEKRGIYGPPEIMRMEHDQFRQSKKELLKLATSPIKDLTKFKKGLDKIAKFIIFNLRDHIFKENTILYPSALKVISAKKDWTSISKQFDEIGYCPFTHGVEQAVYHIELDLRALPPFQRHIKIFEIWEKLKTGKTMRIINDHDPKPLHYQFEAELPNTYDWDYKENGPKDWIVDITKK